MKTIITTLFIAVCTMATAQKIDWHKQIGGAGADDFMDLEIDALNNVYCLGHIEDSTDIDPNAGVKYVGNNYFIIKLGPAGDTKWIRTFDSNIRVEQMGIGNDGIYLATGRVFGEDVDPGASVHHINGAEAVILKLDFNGDFKWAHEIQKTSGSTGWSMVNNGSMKCLNGTLIVAGSYSNSVDFDPSSSSTNSTRTTDAQNERSFVLSLNSSNGAYNWVTCTEGSTVFAYTHGLDISPSGNIFVAMTYQGSTISANVGGSLITLNSKGKDDIALACLNASGSFLWLKQIGGTGNDQISQTLNLKSSGSLLLVGSFEGVVDFDPNSGVVNKSALGSYDTFILELNQQGAFVAVNTLEGNGGSWIPYSTVDKNDNLFISGNFAGMLDLDPSSGKVNVVAKGGIENGLVVVYDKNMNYQHHYLATSGSTVASGLVAVSPSNELYYTAMFKDSINVNAQTSNPLKVSSNGYYDVLLVKHGGWITSARSAGGSALSLNVYPIPAVDELNISLSNLQVASNASYGLYDLTGKAVLQSKINDNTLNTAVFVGDLSSGLYLLKVDVGVESYVRKVIIE